MPATNKTNGVGANGAVIRRVRIAFAATLTALSACSGATPPSDTAVAAKSMSTAIVSERGTAAAPAHEKRRVPATLSAKFGARHVMELHLDAVSFRVSATACSEFTPTLTHCTKGVSIAVEDRSRGIDQTVHPAELWIDSHRTLYSGPLSDSGTPFAGDYSVVWADADGDGSADLIVSTGKDGSYGGLSFDVYLYDSDSHELVHDRALSDLTAGHNSLFTIDHGVISASKASGCCEHVHESYRYANGTLRLIESTTKNSR